MLSVTICDVLGIFCLPWNDLICRKYESVTSGIAELDGVGEASLQDTSVPIIGGSGGRVYNFKSLTFQKPGVNPINSK